MALTSTEEIELLELLEQEDRERVSPKIEQARNTDAMIIIARGGRGAGAKTMGLCSLLVQESHYQCHRVACLREIQNSLEESVYQVIQETVDRLRYPGWKFTREYAESPSGSRWIFRGLKDMRSTTSIKGLQGFTRFFVEEAAAISGESWDILMPTLFRNKGSKLFAAYNPDTETDPVTTKLWGPYTGSPDALLIECRPEGADNPWWGEALQKLSDRMRATDPDLWDHVYGGQPRKQGDNSVMSRPAVRQAMQRKLPSQDGLKEQIGIDVARFGDDKTTIWHRRGMKIIQWRELAGKDTQEVARTAWEMGRRDTAVLFAVDDGNMGAGVSDKLKDMGATVQMVLFGSKPQDDRKYTSVADELWFDFPIDEVEIPDDDMLFEELTQRKYGYDQKDRRKVEPKDEFKKRIGRSPDRADGLLLAFHSRGSSSIMTDEQRAEMASRRR